jgi:hypothetical protein
MPGFMPGIFFAFAQDERTVPPSRLTARIAYEAAISALPPTPVAKVTGPG